MYLREAVNRRPTLSAVLAGAGIVMMLGCSVLWLRANGANRAPSVRFPTQAFYTTDEGATLFADDSNKPPPFDHDGREAVLAAVFTADGGGHHWVQYLEKYSPEAQAQLEALRVSTDSRALNVKQLSDGRLVKKPGTGAWVRMIDGQARDIMTPVAPDGMGAEAPTAVLP